MSSSPLPIVIPINPIEPRVKDMDIDVLSQPQLNDCKYYMATHRVRDASGNVVEVLVGSGHDEAQAINECTKLIIINRGIPPRLKQVKK